MGAPVHTVHHHAEAFGSLEAFATRGHAGPKNDEGHTDRENTDIDEFLLEFHLSKEGCENYE